MLLEHPIQILRHSNYPGSIIALAFSAILPISWPERFIWTMVTTYLATGLALGWLLYRHYTWREAAIGIAAWSLATTQITHHFEDGTLAQLLSLPIVLLCLERFLDKRPWQSLGLLLVSGALHPFSIIFLPVALSISILVRLPWWRQLSLEEKNLFRVWAIVLPVILGVALLLHNQELFAIAYEELPDLSHLSSNRFALVWWLAPLGFARLWWQKRDTLRSVTLSSFALTALILSQSHAGGLSPLPYRFESYLVLAVIIGFSLVVPTLLRLLFATTWTKAMAVIVMFGTLGTASWNANAFVFNFYESPSKYARIHPDEIAAMQWMQSNLPTTAHIGTTNENRHSEWIPIIAERSWTGFDSVKDLLTNPNITYVTFLNHREKVPSPFINQQPVYQNNGAIIFARHPESPL